MRRAAGTGGRCGGERGAAVVDFVLVGGLLTVMALSVIQLALALHVRNTLIDAAASGARYAALADRTDADGVSRTASLITGSLHAGFAQDILVSRASVDGAAVLEVTVRAPLPVIGLLGPAGMLEVRGRAVSGD